MSTSLYTIFIQLKGNLVQHPDGTITLSARLIDPHGKTLKKIQLDKVSINRKSANEMSIYTNGVMRSVQVYQKHHVLHVFDREGNNFQVVNHYDQVEKKKKKSSIENS